MSYQKFVFIAISVVAAATLVASRPRQTANKALTEVANRTMCPIKVVIDDNPDRVPQRIKFLKCDDKPNRLCVENQMTHGCCQHHHHNYQTECVELYDWVQVMYKESSEPATIKVPVGCSCMIEESTQAAEIS